MKRKRLLGALLGGIIILLLAVIGVLAWKYHQASQQTATTQAKKTSDRIISEVSKLYIVPANEEPTVARIEDKNQLENQEFFRHAQNGDYLLIYKKEKVAIVYRENVNKLVTVGPINIADNQQQNPATTTPNGKNTQ